MVREVSNFIEVYTFRGFKHTYTFMRIRFNSAVPITFVEIAVIVVIWDRIIEREHGVDVVELGRRGKADAKKLKAATTELLHNDPRSRSCLNLKRIHVHR